MHIHVVLVDFSLPLYLSFFFPHCIVDIKTKQDFSVLCDGIDPSCQALQGSEMSVMAVVVKLVIAMKNETDVASLQQISNFISFLSLKESCFYFGISKTQI